MDESVALFRGTVQMQRLARTLSTLSLAALATMAACSPESPAEPFAPRVAGAILTREISLPDFRSVVQTSQRAVVDVLVSGMLDEDEDSRLTGIGGSSLPQGHPRPQAHGQGSGFIVSPDGLLLTAAHVVRGADMVTVRLADRREFAARVLGIDSLTDVAVLRIAGSRLPTVRLGDSGGVRTGDWVMAIGSPFGFEHSATAGLVSAVARAVPGNPAVRFLQTDVPLNPGNSGGPLFDVRGHVVGINAQIFSLTGGYQGVSFAIPIDLAAQVARQILATGYARHGTLGVSAQELDASLAMAFGLASPGGALLAQVEDGGAAAQAGLRAGDLVLAIAGRQVFDCADFSAAVAAHLPGERLELQVWRSGVRQAVGVVLGDGSVDPPAQAAAASSANDGHGLSMRPLQPQDSPAAERGLMVDGVSGRAERAGLQPGDILLAIDGRVVESVEEAGAALGERPVALLVQRGRERRFIALPPVRPASG
jgi:serine protease Do